MDVGKKDIIESEYDVSLDDLPACVLIFNGKKVDNLRIVPLIYESVFLSGSL